MRHDALTVWLARWMKAAVERAWFLERSRSSADIQRCPRLRDARKGRRKRGNAFREYEIDGLRGTFGETFFGAVGLIGQQLKSGLLFQMVVSTT
jgi:hypothetical protein